MGLYGWFAVEEDDAGKNKKEAQRDRGFRDVNVVSAKLIELEMTQTGLENELIAMKCKTTEQQQNLVKSMMIRFL